MISMIEIKDVSLSYVKGLKVIDDINFEVLARDLKGVEVTSKVDTVNGIRNTTISYFLLHLIVSKFYFEYFEVS
jgi:hypothetical protein